ncbi:hypothetical protein [Actinomycetospora sp. NBRC 106378]|uniref:hypothetical protein n=1 Tax=Actinomycetospora sp. NBRC 106378 TaxID=3032208 RepID=UPI0025524886|nr:hypothetical protein [Actinomycetospora sp. NBRC 106378]
MPRRSRADPSDLSALAPLAVARVADLVALGVPSATVAQRVRSGRRRRPFPGVILMQSGPPTQEQQVLAAMLYAGKDSVLSGIEAARRHDLRRLPDDGSIHLLVPEDRRRRFGNGVLIERTQHRPPTVLRGGLLVASVERAVLDTARHCSDRDRVRAMLAETVQRRRTTVERLQAELDAGNQRGSGLVRDVLEEIADGIRSAAEGWGRDLHARSGLPPMLWNPTLRWSDGRFLARPDGYLIEVGLAWEQDSLEFHPVEEDDTARRRARMVSAGVVVAHHRPRRLRTEPALVLEELWSHFRLAAARPTPNLIVVPMEQGVRPDARPMTNERHPRSVSVRESAVRSERGGQTP